MTVQGQLVEAIVESENDQDEHNTSHNNQKLSDKQTTNSCSMSTNISCCCNRCKELYMNPWKDLKIDRTIDDALQELLDLIINEYIQSWYVCQTEQDEHFIHEVRLAIKYVIANVIKRFRAIKSVEIFIDSIGPIVTSHLDAFIKANVDLSSTVETIVGKYARQNQMHEALTNRQKETDWIRLIVTECMPYLLPPRYLTCKLVRTLLRELFASGIIQPALDLASKPDSIYSMLDYLLAPNPDNGSYLIFLYPLLGSDWMNMISPNQTKQKSHHEDKVELLRNFIEMRSHGKDKEKPDSRHGSAENLYETIHADTTIGSSCSSLISIEERLVKDLSAWSATISRVECRLDQEANRKYFCFLINVHRLVEIPKPPESSSYSTEDTQDLRSQSRDTPSPSPSSSSSMNPDIEHYSTAIQQWQIDRRYDEFYALESRLRKFHGDILNDVILPTRRTFERKGHDFMQSRQMEFERFLQCLLAIPSLRRSESVRTFLSNPSIRFTESMLPDLNISKMIKTVPAKLSQERGQHLEGFLMEFVNSTETPEVEQQVDMDDRSLRDQQVIDDGTRSSLSSLLRQSSMDDTDDNFEFRQEKQEQERLYQSSSRCQFICHHLYDCLLYLLLRIYKINNWLTNMMILFQFLMGGWLQSYCKTLLLHVLTRPTIIDSSKDCDVMINNNNNIIHVYKDDSVENSKDDHRVKPVSLIVIHALRDALFPNNKQSPYTRENLYIPNANTSGQQEKIPVTNNDNIIAHVASNGEDKLDVKMVTKCHNNHDYDVNDDNDANDNDNIATIGHHQYQQQSQPPSSSNNGKSTQDDVATTAEYLNMDINFVDDCCCCINSKGSSGNGSTFSSSPLIGVACCKCNFSDVDDNNHINNNNNNDNSINSANVNGGDSGASCDSSSYNGSEICVGDIDKIHHHHGQQRQAIHGQIDMSSLLLSSSSSVNNNNNYSINNNKCNISSSNGSNMSNKGKNIDARDSSSGLTEQHRLALKRLTDVLPNWLIQQFLGGDSNHEMACKLILSSLEHSQLNKQIIFLLLNVYLRELFPELILE